MAGWVRDEALMSMTCPLPGQDPLIPIALAAQEDISQCFTYEIDAISQGGVVDADKLLNQAVCLTLRDANGPIRYFHGIVQEVQGLGHVRGQDTADQFQKYHLKVVPRLWFLHQTHDYRVYLNKSTKDILTSIFQDAKLTDFTFAVSAGPSRPYTVQYDESDYAFVKRLMEGDGWFYFFEHTASKHNLVIADANTAFKTIPDATLHFAPPDVVTNDTAYWDAAGVTKWHTALATTTGQAKWQDYDPTQPGTKLQNEKNTVLKTPGTESRDVFRWPARTTAPDVVEARARFELEAVEMVVAQKYGESHAAMMVPGGKFTLQNSPADADDGTYYLRSVTHKVQDDSWISGDGRTSYGNEFLTIPFAVPCRDRPYAPRPIATGIHTGIVLGPQNDVGGTIKMQDGEEIFTDDLARVKVRFFWDHRAEASGSASAWARVVQPWAGNGWGAQFLPRVGTEVAVAFVDGDPDQPVVLGGLYNGIAAPVYAPADKTKSGFRTRSSLKGDASKFNELTFDDKAGNELIFIHAEKDLTTEVEHDESLTVDNCRVVLVKSDETITVKGKQTIKITKDHSFEVTEGNYTSKITKGDSSYELTKGNHSEKVVFGNASYEVKGNHGLKVKMGNHSTEVSTGNYDLKVSLGNITVKAGVGAISMEALQGIELKVGPSSIKIDPMGVTIKGMMIKIEGTVMTDIKGLMTKVGGDAMLMIKGAITMIN